MDEREFELLNILGKELGSNQRDISRKMALSLGMVNMIIRRLITKGYIRIEQLNKRKVQYLLTPKGFSEKIQKSVKYTLNTINAIGLIKESVREVIMESYQQGNRKFYIYSQSDLASIIQNVFLELNLQEASLHALNAFEGQALDGILLYGFEQTNDERLKQIKYINLLREISHRQNLNQFQVEPLKGIVNS